MGEQGSLVKKVLLSYISQVERRQDETTEFFSVEILKWKWESLMLDKTKYQIYSSQIYCSFHKSFVFILCLLWGKRFIKYIHQYLHS